MGMLLSFSAKASRSTPVARDDRRDQAKILLFTGVRYDRMHENGKAAHAQPKPRTDRSRAKQ